MVGLIGLHCGIARGIAEIINVSPSRLDAGRVGEERPHQKGRNKCKCGDGGDRCHLRDHSDRRVERGDGERPRFP